MVAKKGARSKGQGSAGADADASPEAVLHKQRVQEALRGKVLASASAASALPPASASPPATEDAYAGLTFSDQILKSDGKDIVKKGATRKNRYLLVFNGWVDLARSGKLGTLKDADTQNPYLVIDFPDRKGSLKLLGTIVFPSSKYAVMNFEAKKNIVVEEVFDSMVVFTKGVFTKWADGGEGGPVEEEEVKEEVKAEAAAGGAGDNGAGAKDESGARGAPQYRCGATTGEPRVVQVAARERSRPSLLLAGAGAGGAVPSIVGGLGGPGLDADASEGDEEDEVYIVDDDDSDVCFQVGPKKRKSGGGGGNANSAAAAKPRPKRQKRKSSEITLSQPAAAAAEEDGDDEKAFEEDIEDAMSEGSEPEADDDDSDWEG